MEKAQIALMFGVVVGVLWMSAIRPASSSDRRPQTATPALSDAATVVRQKWEYADFTIYTDANQRGTYTYTVRTPKGRKSEKGSGNSMDVLKMFGSDGWELVAVTHSETGDGYHSTWRYTFRRPL